VIACICFSAKDTFGLTFRFIVTPPVSNEEPEILLRQFGRAVSQSMTQSNVALRVNAHKSLSGLHFRTESR